MAAPEQVFIELIRLDKHVTQMVLRQAGGIFLLRKVGVVKFNGSLRKRLLNDALRCFLQGGLQCIMPLLNLLDGFFKQRERDLPLHSP
ncbi:hypothetical protein D3C72_1602920 [compost metagenome]